MLRLFESFFQVTRMILATTREKLVYFYVFGASLIKKKYYLFFFMSIQSRRLNQFFLSSKDTKIQELFLNRTVIYELILQGFVFLLKEMSRLK